MRRLIVPLLLLAATAAAQEPDVRPIQRSDSYTYSVDALRATLEDPAVFAFQLHLAWGEADTLQGTLVAVDADGALLDAIPGTFADRALDPAHLAAMDDIAAEELNAQPPALASHLLHPRIAGAFIADWTALRESGAPLAPALTQAEQPLRYHTIDKVMVTDIVQRAETAELVVFWGLNAAGSLTPVLMGIDANNAEMVGSVAEIGFAMDFVTPCPPTCAGGGDEKGGLIKGAGPPGGLSP
jgi:hypothetical protein